MKTSVTGIKLIKEFEGLKLKPYLCSAGIPTIGYGTTFIGGEKVSLKTLPITQEEAEEYLRKDLETFEKGVSKLVTVPLNQNQFDALVSFAYNLGITALKNSTLLKLVNKNDPKASEQFMRWVNAGGKPSKGLVNRRTKEKSLFDKKQ